MGREGALMPLQHNGSANAAWAHRSREGSVIKDAAGEKENVYPILEKRKEKEMERDFVSSYGDSDRQGKTGTGEVSVISGEELVNEQVAADATEDEDEEPFVRVGGGRGDIARHQAAYARMTALAAPFPQFPLSSQSQNVIIIPDSHLRQSSESLPATPTQKRRRIEEIAGSDTASTCDPGSPNQSQSVRVNGDQSADSTPWRPPKRLKANEGEVRRKSAPGEMGSSLEEGGRYGTQETGSIYVEKYEDMERALKEEKVNSSSPTWLVELIQSIRPKHPDSSFVADGDSKVKCLDCDGKLYSMTKQYVGNFERHLNSKQHLQNVELRKLKGDTINALGPTGKAEKYPLPVQEPLKAYAVKDEQSLTEARSRYLQLLENETTEKGIRVTMLQRRIEVSEKKNSERIEKLQEQVDEYDQRSMEEIRDLNEGVRFAKEEMGSRVQDLDIRIDGFERTFNDRVDNLEESMMELKVQAKVNESIPAKAEKARREGEKRMEDFRETTINRVQNFSGMLAKNDQTNLEKFEGITDRLSKMEKGEVRSDRFKEMERKVRYYRDRIDEVDEKVKEVKDAANGRLEALVGKLDTCEKAAEAQQETLSTLEMTMQVFGEDFKSSRQLWTEREDTIEGVKKKLDGTMERVVALEVESEERGRKMDALTSERFGELETEMDRSFQAMEAEYESHIEDLLVVFNQQKQKILEQKELVQSQSQKLDRQQTLLEKFNDTLRQHNELIQRQNKRLEENDKQMKEQTRRLEKQTELVQHLQRTVPAFMLDLRKVDDKIEDFIEDYREEAAIREVAEATAVADTEEASKNEKRNSVERRKSLMSLPKRRFFSSSGKKRKIRFAHGKGVARRKTTL